MHTHKCLQAHKSTQACMHPHTRMQSHLYPHSHIHFCCNGKELDQNPFIHFPIHVPIPPLQLHLKSITYFPWQCSQFFTLPLIRIKVTSFSLYIHFLSVAGSIFFLKKKLNHWQENFQSFQDKQITEKAVRMLSPTALKQLNFFF